MVCSSRNRNRNRLFRNRNRSRCRIRYFRTRNSAKLSLLKKLDPSKNRKGFISIISINNLSRVKLGED